MSSRDRSWSNLPPKPEERVWAEEGIVIVLPFVPEEEAPPWMLVMSSELGLPFLGFRSQVLGMGTSHSPDTRLTREVLVLVVRDGPR